MTRAGRTLVLTYDAEGLLQSISDWTARTVQYNYEEHGGQFYLTDVTDVLGQTIDYTYQEAGGSWYLATITDQRGLPTPTVQNTYDAGGRVIEQRDGNGNLTTFVYGSRAESDTTMIRDVTVEGEPRQLETVHPHMPGYKLLISVENPPGKLDQVHLRRIWKPRLDQGSQRQRHALRPRRAWQRDRSHRS